MDEEKVDKIRKYLDNYLEVSKRDFRKDTICGILENIEDIANDIKDEKLRKEIQSFCRVGMGYGKAMAERLAFYKLTWKEDTDWKNYILRLLKDEGIDLEPNRSKKLKEKKNDY